MSHSPAKSRSLKSYADNSIFILHLILARSYSIGNLFLRNIFLLDFLIISLEYNLLNIIIPPLVHKHINNNKKI